MSSPAASPEAPRGSRGASTGDVRTRSCERPDHDAVQGRARQPGDVGARSLFWRNLSALWLAAFAPLFQVGWLDHRNSERGAAGSVCLQQPNTATRLGGSVSQSERRGSYTARWKTLSADHREAGS